MTSFFDRCPSSLPDAHPAGRMVSAMKTSLLLRNYFVLAVDTEADWRNIQVDVRATSRDEAKRIARAKLARTRRDHWSIELVLEAA